MVLTFHQQIRNERWIRCDACFARQIGANVGSIVFNQANYRYTNAAMHGTLVDGMQHGANVVIDSIT